MTGKANVVGGTSWLGRQRRRLNRWTCFLLMRRADVAADVLAVSQAGKKLGAAR